MKIVVLLYTFNGGPYLENLVKSIFEQDIAGKAEIEILVRDDGSADNTKSILDTLKSEGKLTWYSGDNIGRTKSFWELMGKAGEADYYAFAEQDELWLPEKLSRAVKYIETKAIIEGEETEVADGPMLYCGECYAANSKLKPVGVKRNPSNKYTDFEHSLIYSSKPGSTYVFNKAALKEILRYDPENFYVAEYEDLVRNIMFIAGAVIFDRVPVLYRRKSRMNPQYLGGFMDKIKLLFLSGGGVDKEKSNTAKALLEVYAKDLEDSKRLEALKLVANYIDDPETKEKLMNSAKFSTGSYVDKWFASAVKSNKL